MRTIAPSLLCFLFVAMIGCASWLMKGEPPEVLYDITGRLHLKDGYLPFDTSGILLEKGQLSGAPSP